MGYSPALIPPEGLFVAGLCHQGNSTIALIAPEEPRFWRLFTASREYADGQPNPMDRWSRRVISAWAEGIGAKPLFPSDGPPFAPFIEWALASGRCWSSPTGMLVHDRMGLFISFRGALMLSGHVRLVPPAPNPCTDCDKPCLSACPVDAFAEGYTPAICHDFLSGMDGADCLSQGCAVRRACPLSKGCGRLPEQSAWHMRQFHP